MLLDAVDLQFAYRLRPTGDQPRARTIDGVSLGIDAGTVVGVLGPNGSGKTTLIRLLSGALTPTSGEVTLNGKPLASMPRHALARRLAVVPQETHLAFDYTVLEIVLMGRYPRLRAFEIEGPEDLRSAMDALGATGTRDLASRPFPTLSGGEKQRVIIASALAQLDEGSDRVRLTAGAAVTSNPDFSIHHESLLFLDEPTASLDLHFQLELLALLKRLNRDLGIAMFLSTHDLRLASSLCSNIVLLSGGRVLAEGPPGDVLTPALIGDLYGISPHLVAPLLT